MRLTFSFKTTARIVRLFEIVNDWRFIAAMIVIQILLARLFFWLEWDWTAMMFAALVCIDAARLAYIKLRRQSAARRS